MQPGGHWSCWLPVAQVGKGQLPLSTVSYTQYRQLASTGGSLAPQLLADMPAVTPTTVNTSTAGIRSDGMTFRQ